MSDPLQELASMFERFPGIGPRQARRFVEYLLGQSASSRGALAEAIRALQSRTALCGRCFRWFVKGASSSARCAVCADASREGALFVVEKSADIDAAERGGFRGGYFVLGGVIPLAEEEPGAHIRLSELLARLEEEGAGGILREVILGLSATSEGDHTRLILQEKILPLSQAHGFTLSSLGRGLSTGSELEYADPETMRHALGGRK